MSVFIKKKSSFLVSKKSSIFFNPDCKKGRFLASKNVKVSKKINVLKNKTRQVFLSSSSEQVLLNYWNLLEKNLNVLGYPYVFFNLPSTKKRITLLKSPHVHKKAKEQFELVTHKITILLSPEVNIFFIKNFFIKKPPSVSFKVVFSDMIN